MIDEKKIGVAADDYSLIKSTPNGVNDYDINLRKGFIEGINWFKDNLWHPATERPKGYTLILMEYTITDTGIKQYAVATTKSYSYYKDNGLRRWLYITDLLK